MNLFSLAAQFRQGPVQWWGLAASLVLIAVAVAVSLAQRLGLERDMVVAAVRAAAQLLAVGAVLLVILDPRQPLIWSWLWIAGMVLFAAVVVRRRAPDIPGLLPLALVALTASAAVSLGVIFGLSVFPLQSRTLVPIGGMVIGNSMAASVVVAKRIVAELSDKRHEVEARLALGLPWRDAARPYLRAALRIATVPQVETTKAVGLVLLPGAMTGLILAGVSPLGAVLVQAAVMYLILGSVATTVTVIGLGLTRRLFTADHRLVQLRRDAA